MLTRVLAALLACSGVATTAGNRYVCDTHAIETVADEIADIDYDQRKQQKEINDFNDQLDALLVAAAANNTCGTTETHNSDQSTSSVLVGGCENKIYTGADWSAVGGGQQNWAYTDAADAAINGGLHNIVTGKWGSVNGGVKNKAYSNYATVIGGYLNKAVAKFATVLGGSRNTVSGRYSIGMGYKVKVTGEYSAGLGFSGASCYIRGDNAFGVCADELILSGDFGEFDLVSELGTRRELSEVTKSIDAVEDENAELEKAVREKIAALLDSGRVSADTADAVSGILSSL